MSILEIGFSRSRLTEMADFRNEMNELQIKKALRGGGNLRKKEEDLFEGNPLRACAEHYISIP